MRDAVTHFNSRTDSLPLVSLFRSVIRSLSFCVAVEGQKETG